MTAPHPIVHEMMLRRADLGLTTVDIHTLTGVARSTVRNWEAGHRDPQLGALDAYLRALGLKLAIVSLGEIDTVVQDDQLPYGQLVLGEGEAWCSGCMQARPVRDFDVDRSKPSGRRSRCKFCRLDRREQRERERTRQERDAPAAKGAA